MIYQGRHTINDGASFQYTEIVMRYDVIRWAKNFSARSVFFQHLLIKKNCKDTRKIKWKAKYSEMFAEKKKIYEK